MIKEDKLVMRLAAMRNIVQKEYEGVTVTIHLNFSYTRSEILKCFFPYLHLSNDV